MNRDIPRWLAADEKLSAELWAVQRRWLVTGAAGFIGSHIIETLLLAGQQVRGLDNFATGHRRNLEEVERAVGPENWRGFDFVEGDIRDEATLKAACSSVDIVLHQAALGSVPRSIKEPLVSNDVNVGGFLTVIEAARHAGVSSFVYAASSSTYGDEPHLPKIEHRIGKPLSPYAVTKLVNELYADVYARSYGFRAIGLRYFNVFGPRQDPNGAYAAVIPKWTSAIIEGRDIQVFGDGETSRDFCYVANAVQANLKAALAPEAAKGEVYNVAVGERTTLNELFHAIRSNLSQLQISYTGKPNYLDFRPGDVRHSQADIGKASQRLGYCPSHGIDDGLREAMPWYLTFFQKQAA